VVAGFDFASFTATDRVRFGGAADFLDFAFLTAFFAGFFEVFFATRFFVFFAALFRVEELLFFERVLVVDLAVLRVFFAFFFFEAVFLAATTNSSNRSIKLPGGCYSAERLLRSLRKQPEHRENQRFSFQVVF
jgi:hypothetical protein